MASRRRRLSGLSPQDLASARPWCRHERHLSQASARAHSREEETTPVLRLLNSHETSTMQGQVTEATKTQSSQGVKEDTCTENKARGKKESLPISKVPVISMGVFEGERAKAKAMARELASLWELPQIKNEIEDGCFASDTYEKNNKTMQRNFKQDNKRKKRRNNNRRDQKLDRFF